MTAGSLPFACFLAAPDFRNAIRSAICPGEIAASSPSGMSDSGDTRMSFTSARAIVSANPI